MFDTKPRRNKEEEGVVSSLFFELVCRIQSLPSVPASQARRFAEGVDYNALRNLLLGEERSGDLLLMF